MLVGIGQWYRNKGTGRVCVCVALSGAYVYVQYTDTGHKQKFRIEQFRNSFQITTRPATSR